MYLIIAIVIIVLIIFTAVQTVQQGTVVVITVFGKYKRILQPGLNMKIPLIEQVYKR
jgi:regulator of protease activity HflC (stomatin/prohibitin superfamily)